MSGADIASIIASALSLIGVIFTVASKRLRVTRTGMRKKSNIVQNHSNIAYCNVKKNVI